MIEPLTCAECGKEVYVYVDHEGAALCLGCTDLKGKEVQLVEGLYEAAGANDEEKPPS